MSVKRIFAALIFATLLFVEAPAQLNLPTKTIGTRSYYWYEVNKKDDIYSIANKIGVSKETLLRYNPSAREGIDEGQILYLPVDEMKNLGTGTTAATAGVRHVVQDGESVYGIARTYGITTDQLIAANPQAQNGVEEGQVLIIPERGNATASNTSDADSKVRNAFGRSNTATTTTPATTTTATPATATTSTPAMTNPQGKSIIHIIEQGENIYSIAKRYNVTVEGILAANPGLEPAAYVPGERIRLTPGSALPFNCERGFTQFSTRKAERGETFATIAKANNVTEDEVKAANPGMKKVKKGKDVVIPHRAVERGVFTMDQVTVEDLEAYYSPRIDQIYAGINGGSGETINIGIVLPFQLHKADPPRQALLYTDFYKGFLIALDSARHFTNKHINLQVYDTRHNLNVTDSILQLPELTRADVIIAPSEPKQLQRVNAFGRDHNVKILNCFTTKNEDYNDNPQVLQVNIPTEQFTAGVTHWFDNKFGTSDYNVIFLEGGQETMEMYSDIKKHITDRGYYTSTVNVGNELSYNDLSRSMNPGTKYVVFPSSSKKAFLKAIMPALKRAKQERFDCELTFIGYPEYVLYLKDYQKDLQTVDSYLFSRFFNTKGAKTRDFKTYYSRWFKGEPLSSVPDMGLYGYDTGMYLIKTLAEQGNIDENAPLYRGIQTSFKFERLSNWSGYVNRSFDIVHFAPEMTIEKMVQE